MCGTGGGGGVSSLVIVMVAICIMIERVGAAALLLDTYSGMHGRRRASLCSCVYDY